jgi:hypothetical protein
MARNSARRRQNGQEQAAAADPIGRVIAFFSFSAVVILNTE